MDSDGMGPGGHRFDSGDAVWAGLMWQALMVEDPSQTCRR